MSIVRDQQHLQENLAMIIWVVIGLPYVGPVVLCDININYIAKKII